MSWRERIAAIIARGGRSDLTTPAYHATKNVFPAFENQPMNKSYMIDRALGTHAAKDPALASSEFFTKEPGSNVMPLAIPAEDKFLQAVQPVYPGRGSGSPLWRNVATDQAAIEQMATQKAFEQNPDILERYLLEARRLPPSEAATTAHELTRGGTVRSEGLDMDLQRFVRNYGGKPYNDADRQAVVDLARDAWEKEGYKGIRYINTAPMEAGAPGVKDPTSYIVFRPENIRSQFAQFDPAKIGSSNLLAGVAGLAAVPFGIGAVADQSRYEARQ
jgi:hypothetical protein